MLKKLLHEESGLLLQSRVRDNRQQSSQGPVKSVKQTKAPMHSQTKRLQNLGEVGAQIAEQAEFQQNRNINNSYMKSNSILKESTKLANNNKEEMSRLLEQADLSKRNLVYEIEFYVRERMKDLVTIQQLLLAKQYQRMYVYVQTELNLLRKLHQSYLYNQETFCKPMLTKDISVKSNIEEDSSYKSLISNLVENLKQFDINNIFVLPIIKKLSSQVNLSTKKLSWYFEQIPFEAPSHHISTNLAIKFIGDLGCNNGHKILDQIAKSIQLKTNKKYNGQIIDEIPPKSQMSKLIEQHSNSRIKTNKGS